MRPLLAAVLVALAAAPAAAQPARSILLAVVVDGGGSTETTEPRFAGQAGYAVEETAGSGLSIGARYVVGVHALSGRVGPDSEAGPGVTGNGGWLVDTGVDAEVGWRLGPLRPYGYTGYHYYRQRIEEGLCGSCEPGDPRVAARRDEGFARASGYGLSVDVSSWGAFYAERFRGGGRSGVMRLDGIRAGIRFGW